ncbi:MAG: hypothetical protein DRN30_02110 [Thermoplasmata archaeon]|nr:hypothetical protein [Euryarchaeota archaeon]RLF66433.1 MAG: hypothetical protein DRN30_02110 [Thermoplasmata archaeon]
MEMLKSDHILILNVLKTGPIGRVFLSEFLNIGEGKIRKLLKDLKGLGLIESSKAGHYLSDRGKKFLEKFERTYFKITRRIDITIFDWPYAIEGIIRGKALKKAISRDGMTERDLIVRNGALGAIISIYRNGEARLPDSMMPITAAIPGYSYDNTISEDLNEGDLLVIVGGESFYNAAYAFIKGAMTLVGEITL